MHALLSGLLGAVLVVLIYGLSYLPSTTLDRWDDSEEVIGVDAGADAGTAATAPATRRRRPERHGLNLGMVEPTGIEPVTSAVRLLRSPN